MCSRHFNDLSKILFLYLVKYDITCLLLEGLMDCKIVRKPLMFAIRRVACSLELIQPV